MISQTHTPGWMEYAFDCYISFIAWNRDIEGDVCLIHSELAEGIELIAQH